MKSKAINYSEYLSRLAKSPASSIINLPIVETLVFEKERASFYYSHDKAIIELYYNQKNKVIRAFLQKILPHSDISFYDDCKWAFSNNKDMVYVQTNQSNFGTWSINELMSYVNNTKTQAKVNVITIQKYIKHTRRSKLIEAALKQSNDKYLFELSYITQEGLNDPMDLSTKQEIYSLAMDLVRNIITATKNALALKIIHAKVYFALDYQSHIWLYKVDSIIAESWRISEIIEKIEVDEVSFIANGERPAIHNLPSLFISPSINIDDRDSVFNKISLILSKKYFHYENEKSIKVNFAIPQKAKSSIKLKHISRLEHFIRHSPISKNRPTSYSRNHINKSYFASPLVAPFDVKGKNLQTISVSKSINENTLCRVQHSSITKKKANKAMNTTFNSTILNKIKPLKIIVSKKAKMNTTIE